jgi:hypothetical protein
MTDEGQKVRPPPIEPMQEEKITALTAAIRGTVIAPAKPEYETARKVFRILSKTQPQRDIPRLGGGGL